MVDFLTQIVTDQFLDANCSSLTRAVSRTEGVLIPTRIVAESLDADYISYQPEKALEADSVCLG